MKKTTTNLITAAALREKYGSFRVLDGSWFLDKSRDPRKEFQTVGHLPRSSFFDVDAIADKTRDLPHMLPPKALFDEYCSSVGLQLRQERALLES